MKYKTKHKLDLKLNYTGSFDDNEKALKYKTKHKLNLKLNLSILTMIRFGCNASQLKFIVYLIRIYLGHPTGVCIRVMFTVTSA